MPGHELPASWAKDMTEQYRRILSTRRMNALSQRPAANRAPSYQSARYSSPSPMSPPMSMPSHAFPFNTTNPPPPTRAAPTAPLSVPPQPSHTSMRNIPLVPKPPTDRQSLRFRSMLHSLSNTPCLWENPGLLDEALRVIPLELIYEEAQEESETLAAEAATLGPNTKPAWGYQDCVVRALMRWFRKSFFEWVNNPKCTACSSPTIAMGMAAPLPDEVARGANRVELYQCSHAHCQSFERFPRYTDAFVLLQTRRGRAGEWASCFSMLCRAVGSRVRWVWNSEDHVWTEVYSVHRKRWVHVDVVEELWNQPLVYTQGTSCLIPPMQIRSLTITARLGKKVGLLHRLFCRWCHGCDSSLRPQPCANGSSAHEVS